MKHFFLKTIAVSVLSFATTAAIAQELVENDAEVGETTYQDWTLRCQQVETSEQDCFMIQLIQLEESGELLMQVNIASIPDREEPIMSIALPLGVALADGVKMQLGEVAENANMMGYSHCTQGGCYVNQLLSDEAVQRITAAKSGGVTFVTLSGEAIDVPFSPLGFAEALAAMRQ
jgi:invasion protein IalB